MNATQTSLSRVNTLFTLVLFFVKKHLRRYLLRLLKMPRITVLLESSQHLFSSFYKLLNSNSIFCWKEIGAKVGNFFFVPLTIKNVKKSKPEMTEMNFIKLALDTNLGLGAWGGKRNQKVEMMSQSYDSIFELSKNKVVLFRTKRRYCQILALFVCQTLNRFST